MVTQAEMDRVIEDCVDAVRGETSPAAAIDAYVQRLIAFGWQAEPAREVGRRALELVGPRRPQLNPAETAHYLRRRSLGLTH